MAGQEQESKPKTKLTGEKVLEVFVAGIKQLDKSIAEVKVLLQAQAQASAGRASVPAKPRKAAPAKAPADPAWQERVDRNKERGIVMTSAKYLCSCGLEYYNDAVTVKHAAKGHTVEVL